MPPPSGRHCPSHRLPLTHQLWCGAVRDDSGRGFAHVGTTLPAGPGSGASHHVGVGPAFPALIAPPATGAGVLAQPGWCLASAQSRSLPGSRNHEGEEPPRRVAVVGMACPTAGPNHGGGHTHLPVAGRTDAGVAGVQPVPSRHICAAAMRPGPPNSVCCMPATPLHTVLELPGPLPLLQRHLRGARGGGAALPPHPQSCLSLPPWLLCACRLLPRTCALSSRCGCDRLWHLQPEHSVRSMPHRHLLGQPLKFRGVPSSP